MIDMGRWQPAEDEPLHPIPRNPSVLTPPFENVALEATDREAILSQGIPVSRNAEITPAAACLFNSK